jgi:hypothetical protein
MWRRGGQPPCCALAARPHRETAVGSRSTAGCGVAVAADARSRREAHRGAARRHPHGPTRLLALPGEPSAAPAVRRRVRDLPGVALRSRRHQPGARENDHPARASHPARWPVRTRQAAPRSASPPSGRVAARMGTHRRSPHPPPSAPSTRADRQERANTPTPKPIPARVPERMHEARWGGLQSSNISIRCAPEIGRVSQTYVLMRTYAV